MAEPSNIRVNPFTGTGGATNYVELTEKHIIPAVSPYVIRLNEVPEKQDPSNMKMVYVDSATGAATENALTEVAATPGQGEFRPDYSTNAMEDKTWNTGLIEFSASDAGKIVQVTYTGTGTLAGVNSNHWPSWYTDRGDGSDGDFVPTENTNISGVKNYKSVFIKSGITVTIDKYVLIKCQGAFVNEGTISGDGKGGVGGVGSRTTNNTPDNDPSELYYNPAPGEAGMIAGGTGGNGSGGFTGSFGGEVLKEYLDLRKTVYYWGYGAGGGAGGGGDSKTHVGGSAGSGGGGGASLSVIANTISNSGTITLKGLDGTEGKQGNYGKGGGGGGGGGGCLDLIANTIISGTIFVNGGAGGTGANSGAAGSDGIQFIKELGV